MRTHCKNGHPFDEANTRRTPKGRECRTCHRAAVMRNYYANREAKVAQATVYKAQHKQRNREYLYNYMSQQSCVVCGEADMTVLEFDHVKGTKRGNLARAVAETWSIQRIEEEIAKCDVVCCNCHRRRTGSRGNWYRHSEGGY